MASTTAFRSTLRAGAPAVRSSRTAALPRRFVQQQARRSYATSPAGGSSGGSSVSGTNVLAAVGILGAAGAGFYFYNQDGKKDALNVGAGRAANKLTGAKARVTQQGVGSKQDYQEVYNEIAAELEKDENYDDGSFGPVLVRLAWHASGTYSKDTKTGGSNGATMRFAPEADHGANAGLLHARNFMDEIKAKHSWITYSDLWTLGGVCAVQEMGGPKVPWRPGRKDGEEHHCTPDGRLPDGDKGPDHLRFIFNRMGFNDQEIVALSGAHALGRCHPDRSGFEGPWTFSPTSFTNEYYNLLLTEPWVLKKWNGPKQYVDKKTGSLMMLTTDMALVEDSSFKKHVERYAKDEDTFFNEFSNVYAKLLELGVPTENFKAFEVSEDGGKPYLFATSAELENSK